MLFSLDCLLIVSGTFLLDLVVDDHSHHIELAGVAEKLEQERNMVKTERM